MKYLCLVHQEELSVTSVPERTRDAIEGEMLDHSDELGLSGHLIAASPLHSDQSSITVRVRNGRVTISDGPSPDTKVQLGEFYLIEAKDLNDAIRVASKMPWARLGCIEVRALREFNSY